jgi:membrane protease YdiL (CAAX protease family)
MALALLAGGWILGGAGPPRGWAAWRRSHLRARSVPAAAWRWAGLAGAAGTIGLAAGWVLLSRASAFAPNALPDPTGYAKSLWIPMLAMACAVAPLGEEAGLRGYFQGALERRLPAALAIAITAIVFALLHLQHGLYWEKQLVYLTGGVLWGLLARLSGSILPGICAHALTDVVFFSVVWPRDGKHAAFAWDAEVYVLLGAVALGAAGAAWALLRLARAGVVGEAPGFGDGARGGAPLEPRT